MKKIILSIVVLFAVLIPAHAETSKIDQMAHAIARIEGYGLKGAVPTRFNNPGDITSLSRHAYPGQIGLSPHRHYVIFKNPEYGWAALRSQIQRIIDGTSKYYRQDMTFAQIAHIYAEDKLWGKHLCFIMGISPQITFQEYFGLAPKVQRYKVNVPKILTEGNFMKKIYLAGPISGLTFEGAQDWREQFTAEMAKLASPQDIACYSPLRGKEYLKIRGPLEGSYSEFPLSSDRGITTRDRDDCMGADLVVFNLLGATKRVSIGTMIEFGWADAARVPSVVIMEKEGNIHEYPMVREIAGFRVDNVPDALKIARILLLPANYYSIGELIIK